MKKQRRLTATIVATLAALGGTAGASAETQTEHAPVIATKSVVVRYHLDDLNGDRDEIVERIEAAARAACGPIEVKDFYARRLRRQCYDEAMAGAMRQLENRQRVAAVRE